MVSGDVAGYKVYYGLSTGNYTTTVNVGNTTTTTLQNLSSPTYYIAVTAYDSHNDQSGFSPELVIDLLTASAGTGGTIAPSGSFFLTQGASQTFTITPATGYQIAGVLVDGLPVGAVASYTLSNITASHTINVSFAPTTYTITPTAGANGTISPSSAVTVNYGGSQTFSFTPATGYQVSSVLVDGTAVTTASSYTFSSVSANHTISATFAIDPFTITASAGSNGSISPTGSVTADSGASQTFAITPAANCKISGVTVDGKSIGAVSSHTFTNVTANHTIAATFVPITYIISATMQGSGSISPSGAVSVVSGADQSFTISPAANYKISGVKVDGKSIGAVSSYTFPDVTAHHTIAVTFALIRYRISASLEGAGSISPAGTRSVPSGTNLEFRITPAVHYRLVDVLVDGISTGTVSGGITADEASTYTFTDVSADHTVKAIFSEIPPPVADAGPDQDVESGSIVTLSGSNSTDTVSGIASYRWNQVSGPLVKLSSHSAQTCTFTAPNIASGKLLAFNLTVTNQAGIRNSANCQVNVSGTDKAPSANAGGDQTVIPITNVTLDGSGSSDPDDGIASYSWVQISGPHVAILNANTAQASFEAPDSGPLGVSLVFQLRVTDHFGLTTRDQCTVNVVNADQPPVANAGQDQTAVTMTSVTLDGSSSSDPVNSNDSYRWKQISGVPVTLSDPTAKTPGVTAPAYSDAQSADLLFMLTVTDANDQLSATAKCTVTVTPY